ncbi:MAG TPA: extracellular solute-binding protein [Candidatus Methylomirabilis sp.]|nr:extracellular solute-binding protein [Candidatus Methylomirabilis sp.]
MRRVPWLMGVCIILMVALGGIWEKAGAQQKKIVYWTHWEQNPEFNKWYAAKGKEFSAKTGYEVEVLTIPFQGYEAKYMAALMGKTGAPDFFNGMAQQWCGQYDFCDRMPADLEKLWDENIPQYMVPIGKWKGARYGIPIENGNFGQMYINVDMFKKAGLNPDQPPKNFDELLAAFKKLTILNPKGEPIQLGFAIRHKGVPLGVADKFLSFAHAWGARMLSPSGDKATGYANSPEMVAALQYFGDLVLKHKVASVALGSPEDAFAQKQAAVLFRESWYFGWLKKTAPDVNFKVYALPCQKVCPGAGNLFPWSDLVYKNSPNKQIVWEYMRFISGAKNDLEHHQAQGTLPIWSVNMESDYAKARPDYQSIKDTLARPPAPNYNSQPKSGELATAFGEAVAGVLYGRGEPKPLLDQAAANMDRILKD